MSCTLVHVVESDAGGFPCAAVQQMLGRMIRAKAAEYPRVQLDAGECTNAPGTAQAYRGDRPDHHGATMSRTPARHLPLLAASAVMATGLLSLPAAAQSKDAFDAFDAINPEALFKGLIREDDVSLLFQHLRDTVLDRLGRGARIDGRHLDLRRRDVRVLLDRQLPDRDHPDQLLAGVRAFLSGIA